MLETVLNHLHNWFPIEGAARAGTYSIVSGVMPLDFLTPGQYYRIEGSIFNDGLHRYAIDDTTAEQLEDEVFTGTVTPLAIPKAVQKLAGEIGEWVKNNPATDKVSESFDGYSYTRASGADGSASGGWQAAFRSRLNAWKKVC